MKNVSRTENNRKDTCSAGWPVPFPTEETNTTKTKLVNFLHTIRLSQSPSNESFTEASTSPDKMPNAMSRLEKHLKREVVQTNTAWSQNRPTGLNVAPCALDAI